MYETSHPVYSQLQQIGKEINTEVKPSAIVVFSAHWQAERPNTIEVNVSEKEPLLYDFYGFPRHYYSEKFSNKGSPELAKRVMELLSESGIRTQAAETGPRRFRTVQSHVRSKDESDHCAYCSSQSL